jgi:DNA-directed RNA polymerase specialized sigma24 family protein
LSIPHEYDLSRSQITFLIEEYVFSARDREMLKLRLLDGFTYEKIGEQFDLTPRQTVNIIRKARETVFRHVDRLN